MKIGMALPQFGAQASSEGIARVAVEAERIGLDSVWVMDRLLRPRAPVSLPGGPTVPLPEYYATVLDPLDTLAYVAAKTSRVRLGTSAILAPFHHPVVLARRLATVDRLSGGRLIAGLVLGWMAEELAVAGPPMAQRGPLLDELVAVVRAVWRPDPVSFRGHAYQIPESDIGPKPCQPGGVPLLLGYANNNGIRRAARIADGLHPYVTDVAALQRDVDLFRASAVAAGRDPSALDIVLRADGHLTAVAQPAADRPLFHGSLDQWLEDAERVQTLGVSHVLFGLDAPIDAQLQTMAAFLTRCRP